MATEILRPNAAGDETNLTPNTGANYAAVDEAVADDDTTYVKTYSNSPKDDLYNLPASSGSGTINKITIFVHTKKAVETGYPTCHSRTLIKSGTTTTAGSIKTPTTSYAPYSTEYTTNPDDSEAWEWADIDALQIGVRLSGDASYPNIGSGRCTQVYVEVDYTASVPEITNAPDSNAFGILAVNTTSSTAINYFTITNTGSGAVDITIQGTDLAGGDDTWTLSDTAAPGENIYGLEAGLDDVDDEFDVVVKEATAYNELVNNLAEDATQDWGLKIYMPTSVTGYDAQQMTATVTLVCSAH